MMNNRVSLLNTGLLLWLMVGPGVAVVTLAVWAHAGAAVAHRVRSQGPT